MQSLKGIGTPVLLAGLIAFVAYDHYTRPSAGPAAPVINAEALGKQFVPALAVALADGFDAGADVLDKKGTTENADKAMKQTFFDERQAAFKAKVSPVFAAVVPSGTEPKDDTARRDYVNLWRSFAKGLRGGTK